MLRLIDSKTIAIAVCFGLFAGIGFPIAHGEDWPQWMGPRRDNVWRETGIIESIPPGGLPIVWRAPVAGGYAGPAVANGRVFVADYQSAEDVKIDNFDRKEFTGKERLVCLDATSGKQLWAHEYPVKYTVSYPAGPRVTPTVDGDRVYSLGTEGDLFCFDAGSGKVVWSKDLKVEYKTKAALWGWASHPLIDGDKLICIVGGEGSHAVAFDKRTGKELWRNGTAPEQGYCPPTIFSVAGKRQLILVQPNHLRAVDPESGKPIWSTPYEADNGSIIMTPILWKDHIFLGGFNNRKLLVRLNNDGTAAEPVWKDLADQALSPVNVQPTLEGDILYGFDQDGQLMGVRLPDGKRLFQTSSPISKRKQGSGSAFLVKQADRYWMFNELGEIVLGKLSTQGFAESGRAKVIRPTNNAFGRQVVWCPPAFANRRMYVRNDEECVCVDLSARATQ